MALNTSFTQAYTGEGQAKEPIKMHFPWHHDYPGYIMRPFVEQLEKRILTRTKATLEHRMQIRRISVSLLCGLIPYILVWLAGVNIFQRGMALSMSTLCTIVLIGVIYSLPIWEVKEQ